MEKKIMLVDDETVMGKMMQSAFKGEKDHSLTYVESGTECLKKLSEGFRPDVILLDVMMPQMTGYEVCSAIKSNDDTKNLKVIYYSALGSEVLRKKTEETKADGFMEKDIDLFGTIEKIKNLA